MIAQIRDVRELTPRAAAMCGEWQRRCAAKGIPVLVYETYRTPERQAELYAKGRTAPGPIVTHAKPGQSRHQAREAWDAVPWEVYVSHQGAEIYKRLDWDPFPSAIAARDFLASLETAGLTATVCDFLDPRWSVMAKAALELDIEWAGAWLTFREYVHFQLPKE